MDRILLRITLYTGSPGPSLTPYKGRQLLHRRLNGVAFCRVPTRGKNRDNGQQAKTHGGHVSHPLYTRSNRAESGPTPRKWEKEQKPSFFALRKPVPLLYTFSREATNSATASSSGRAQHHAFHTTLSLETYHPMHATALCSSTRGNIAHAHETWGGN